VVVFQQEKNFLNVARFLIAKELGCLGIGLEQVVDAINKQF
jgi:hypothetical protein